MLWCMVVRVMQTIAAVIRETEVRPGEGCAE
jgi:hypothetical protein